MRRLTVLTAVVMLAAALFACESSGQDTQSKNTASAGATVESGQVQEGPVCSELLADGDVDAAARLVMASINAREDSKIEGCYVDESMSYQVIGDETPRPLTGLGKCAVTDLLGYEAMTCTATTDDGRKAVLGFNVGSAGDFLVAIEYSAESDSQVFAEQDCVFYAGGGASGFSPADCSDATQEQARGKSASEIIRIIDRIVPNSAGWGSGYCQASLLEIFDEPSKTTYCLSSAPGYRE